jgi:hypothetical protein
MASITFCSWCVWRSSSFCSWTLPEYAPNIVAGTFVGASTTRKHPDQARRFAIPSISNFALSNTSRNIFFVSFPVAVFWFEG